VFDGKYPTAGGMMLAGNLAVEESNTSRKLYYWEVYHLLGDPAVAVFFGVPQDIHVQHQTTMGLAASTFEVKAPKGAYVGVSMNGALLGAGFTGESGTASLTLKAAQAGKAIVVVTGQNLKPYFGEVQVQ
jgi:hypothetical protein